MVRNPDYVSNSEPLMKYVNLFLFHVNLAPPNVFFFGDWLFCVRVGVPSANVIDLLPLVSLFFCIRAYFQVPQVFPFFFFIIKMVLAQNN